MNHICVTHAKSWNEAEKNCLEVVLDPSEVDLFSIRNVILAILVFLCK